GRRTRPFSGRAFREHRANMGVIPSPSSCAFCEQEGDLASPCPAGGFFQHPARGGSMTRTQWLILGAVLLGLAEGLYILFFCPTDCH
ncbi:MAG: hypothetical protein ABI604_05035, partial [Nitrospirota bacterium]